MSSKGSGTVMDEPDRQGGLVPNLRFPEFQDGDSWQQVSVGQFLTESRVPGSNGHIAKKITVKLWGNGVFAKSDNIKGSENTQYYRRKAGQFIYSKLDFLNQAFGIIPDKLDGFESTVDLPCFDIKDGLCPEFFLEYVKRDTFYKKNGELADGGRKAKRIQVETFLAFGVFLPPKYDEQQKIANCLSSVDKLIAAEADKLDALKDHKKGLMQQLFPAPGETTPRLRFPEFQGAGEWQEKALGPDATKVGSGITPKGGNAAYSSSGRPFMRSQNVGWGELILDNVAFIDEKLHASFPATEIQVGDVLLNITGASIGRSAIADRRISGGNVNQHVCIIRLKAKKLIPGYLNQFLLSSRGQSQIDSFQAGGNRQGLNFEQIRSFEVPRPPALTEQERIADCLSSIDTHIAAQKDKIDGFKMHKNGLMQRLFPAVDEVQA